MSKLSSDIKGFRKSKVGNYISIGSQAFGAVGIYKQAKKARFESDTLKLVDAVVSAAAVATGLALIIREMRRAARGDVLADD
ncbi:hypothetical protein BIV57_14525 [Mangrovactinospora gilvigrisea]|uniref:Uncharacterized protein n=1 Tax=Mangrovactinospora gilvigrisea TaxID=1428644 RepID=A0A1J7BDM3_9ACTN|nr:hypothetical protein [Mangrovactinospora gilvigrisea]OIV36750.1 hypothetical protein BIV57_14525 [Mangrovactinospora gilvigrisea]